MAHTTESQPPPQSYSGGESTEAPIPCRNLTEAFEELVRVEPATEPTARTPAAKQADSTSDGGATKDMSEVSPTGVAELGVGGTSSNASTMGSDGTPIPMEAKSPSATPTAEDANEDGLPAFILHEELKRELSQSLVNRVAFYGVIRDINQEATSMAAHDHSAFAKGECVEEDEHLSPLVISVNGEPADADQKEGESVVDKALIDEERWLLSAIGSRGNMDEPRVCPPTFSEAMGEREYKNPLSSLQTSRTQLWKPSRSWWEAKSGKNPWIEPKSHNKRWRYLWPLIHYHKFLAKCIKKLKRNGVDVKSSASPVAVFLREEVCAVSDHLASVSLFTSEEWMAVLVHFHGWTDSDSKAEARLRKLVSKQKLRPLSDQCDVDSPILRSQIDEQFLKAMATARDQMINGASLQERKSTKNAKAGVVRTLNLSESNRKKGGALNKGTPPLPQYIKTPGNSHKQRRRGGKPGSKQQPGAYTNVNGNWSAGGWRHSQQNGDEADAHSGSFSTMSMDVYPQHYGPPEYGVYHGPPGYYQHPYVPATPGSNAPEGYYYHPGPYHQEPMSYPTEQYVLDPAMAAGGPRFSGPPPSADGSIAVYSATPQEGMPVYGPPPGYPGAGASGGEIPASPYHYPPSHPGMESQFSGQQAVFSPHGAPPGTPYFDHFNPVAHLFTPQGKSSPNSPSRGQDGELKFDQTVERSDSFTAPSVNVEFAKNAKPLLINHAPQYYHYAQHTTIDGVVPPSPATQFMMSPQANPQAAAYFARNNGHPSPQQKRGEPVASSDTGNAASPADKQNQTLEASASSHATPPPVMRKLSNARDRSSPSTVQTAAESESINETA